MAMLNSIGSRRWYDQKPELVQCVEFLEAFPAEIRSIVADGVVFMAEREFEVHLLMSSLRSLGPEKILGLYKSKNKRRTMDEDPVLHKAMNYFFILSPPNQLYLARMTNELVTYIYQYFESCKLYHQPSSTRDVKDITSYYVQSGPEKTQEFVSTLQKQFQLKIRSAPALQNQTIMATETGMQIRKNPKK